MLGTVVVMNFDLYLPYVTMETGYSESGLQGGRVRKKLGYGVWLAK